jgi:hypothetical protein
VVRDYIRRLRTELGLSPARPSSTLAVVVIVLPSGLRVRVPLGADAGQVARLVLALGAPPC